jgi:predicted dinucleotide-binding enzyme
MGWSCPSTAASPPSEALEIHIDTDRKNIMRYAIVGFGAVGQALAHAFARKNIEVAVASRRPPEALALQSRAIGPAVVAKSLRDALDADTIFLAVPFGEHRAVAKALPSWKGKTIIDAMNHFRFLKRWVACRPPLSLRGRSRAPSS